VAIKINKYKIQIKNDKVRAIVAEIISWAMIIFLVIVLGLLGGLLSKAHAEEQCRNPEFILNLEQANQVVYFGEELQACKKLVESQDAEIKEQDKRFEEQTMENQALYKANEALEKAIDAYEKTNKLKDEVLEIKDKQIEEAKPTFWDKMGWRLEGAGGTVIILIFFGILVAL